ncbi:MAG: sigma-70 family RNA polymerase sigma factor [Gemmatimonadota bacterium]|nr:sigma-70 family RNA polymerase sigma factor [Gemmatimonadota bacterium]
MTVDLQGDAAADDIALIERWQRGDERAATLLVERHAQPLARFISSLGARHAAKEVVQDTFVRAFASLDRFRADSSLRTWLFTIARNLVRDRMRARRALRSVVEVEEEHAATEHDALDEMVAGETASRLRGAVAHLTPTQREVFTLRVSEGLLYKEIAAIVGSTEGAARVHYFNAVRTVKEFLND